MSKKAAVAIAIVVGVIAVSTPIAISLVLAWKQSFDQQMADVAAIADDVLRRSDESTDQTFVIFSKLVAAGAADPCSDANIRLMGKIDLESEQVQAVGYVANDRLLCSSFGRHDTAVGPPAYLSGSGAYIRPSVEFPVLPGRKFLLSTHKTSGYSTAIHPNLPLDVFVHRSDVSVGVFSTAAKRLVINRGEFKSEWMGTLGEARRADFSDGEHLVAIRHSGKHAFAAYASIPATSVSEGLRRAAMVLVPIGLLAGVALAFAVHYVARLQLALPAVLKVALRRNEFFLNYQPIVDLATGEWVGAEALIRWRRPGGEMVRPDLFIPVAEDSGLMPRITERIVAIIAREASELFRRHPAFHIAINLSSADLHSKTTVELLRRLAKDTNAGPHNLIIEATERGFMKPDVARDVVREVRASGIPVAIDDFGTGYSSLSYLETFELDFLKIDKSFVDTLGTGAATSQVVLHIIEMAKSLKLKMIAEGVETEAQAQFLRDRGVEYAQGWLFGKPMSFADLVARLASAAPAEVSAGRMTQDRAS